MYKVNLKDSFLYELQQIVIGENKVGIALSSGIDSNLVMIGLKKLNIETKAYCMHVEGIDSTDFINAKRNADIFGVEFKEIIIPRILDINIVNDLIATYQCKKKTDIECLYPFYFLVKLFTEKLLLTGYGSDRHFLLSKHAVLNYKDRPQEFRDKYYALPRQNMHHILNEIMQNINSTRTDSPYSKQSIKDYFKDKSWEECNKPFEKHVLWTMFEECNLIKRVKHINMQCGDSGIREIFLPLLQNKEINKRNRIRVMDIYRDIYNETHHA